MKGRPWQNDYEDLDYCVDDNHQEEETDKSDEISQVLRKIYMEINPGISQLQQI